MTPTFEHLARSGTVFENCYSACPVCGPARRTLMTGLSSRGHGDRVFSSDPMPAVTTLPQAFRDAGYQAYAVGTMHWHPQRARYGFDDVILNEEGRMARGPGRLDDYEMDIVERGYAGQEYGSGMASNDYVARPFQLPEECHQTNWTAREACRMISRRDPTRPAFWYVSFTMPHPPRFPLGGYLAMSRDVRIGEPVIGNWARDVGTMPYALRDRVRGYSINGATRHELELAHRAFYALITHIDHQVRLIVGTLREQGLLDNTIIAITADHGDMLGDHGIWAKQVFFDRSANVPLIISGTPTGEHMTGGGRDDRLVELRDVMPTLLEMAGVDIPSHVEGASLLHPSRRETLYGEIHEHGARAFRMVRDQRYKLCYYPMGNRFQLFDMTTDPREATDLYENAAHAEARQRLTGVLRRELHGSDAKWFRDGRLGGDLIGEPEPTAPLRQGGGHTSRSLLGQRGLRFY